MVANGRNVRGITLQLTFVNAMMALGKQPQLVDAGVCFWLLTTQSLHAVLIVIVEQHASLDGSKTFSTFGCSRPQASASHPLAIRVGRLREFARAGDLEVLAIGVT